MKFTIALRNKIKKHWISPVRRLISSVIVRIHSSDVTAFYQVRREHAAVINAAIPSTGKKKKTLFFFLLWGL
jgi:hypothetical protein